MVKSRHGLRAGTRRKLSKKFRAKFTVTPYMRSFANDDKVVINQDPVSHKGMPHMRFKGLTGTVKGKRGSAYIVDLVIGNKRKTITVTPEHLVPASKG